MAIFTAKHKTDQLNAQLKTQTTNIALSLESIAIFQARAQEGQESASNRNTEEANLQVLEADCQTNNSLVQVLALSGTSALAISVGAIFPEYILA